MSASGRAAPATSGTGHHPGSRQDSRVPGGVVLAAILVLGGVGAHLLAAWGPDARVLAADPNAPASQAACEDLFPEEGPAGVDLRLGCTVERLLGHYVGHDPGVAPPRISAYLPAIGALVASLVALAVLITLTVRRAGRRMAPVMPAAWWECPACHSVNGAGILRCYACGRAVPDIGATISTAEHPETPQSFGDPTGRIP